MSSKGKEFSGSPSVKRLSQAEIAKRYAQGLCFNYDDQYSRANPTDDGHEDAMKARTPYLKLGSDDVRPWTTCISFLNCILPRNFSPSLIKLPHAVKIEGCHPHFLQLNQTPMYQDIWTKYEHQPSFSLVPLRILDYSLYLGWKPCRPMNP